MLCQAQNIIEKEKKKCRTESAIFVTTKLCERVKKLALFFLINVPSLQLLKL